MANIYRYNPIAKYPPNGGKWPATIKDLHKHQIFVNERESFSIEFSNVFEGYTILNKASIADKWHTTEYFEIY